MDILPLPMIHFRATTRQKPISTLLSRQKCPRFHPTTAIDSSKLQTSLAACSGKLLPPPQKHGNNLPHPDKQALQERSISCLQPGNAQPCLAATCTLSKTTYAGH
ncbi:MULTISPECIES: hypothetical protein [unclassified Anaerobiospirillum]|uniref:hypothetical protein n=1 Tax=unclassified Anaerobiospirillum TaxID=2647410 RepID=UPI001FF14C96|nr:MULTISPECIES: hypothetical protein [unclassified Anaerobiospirillum]MCK0534584.1 hypothetical protein [Anaerobiospirillum sp. NML120511]MCK0540622.1 hypothetical protein [Anaerobiospirillum sp. NML02-A-032]